MTRERTARTRWILLALALGCSGTTPEPTKPTASTLAVTEKPPAPTTVPAPPGPPASASLPEAKGETLLVDSRRVECQGEGPMQCLRVRKSEADDWELFYSTIEGFEFEEGHRYELRVEVSEVNDPPADATSLRYRLLEVVSKVPAEPK